MRRPARVVRASSARAARQNPIPTVVFVFRVSRIVAVYCYDPPSLNFSDEQVVPAEIAEGTVTLVHHNHVRSHEHSVVRPALKVSLVLEENGTNEEGACVRG